MSYKCKGEHIRFQFMIFHCEFFQQFFMYSINWYTFVPQHSYSKICYTGLGSLSKNHLHLCCNYRSQWWVEFEFGFDFTLDCLQLRYLMKCYILDTYMKVKKMRIKEILRKIWLLSANKIKSSESKCKQSSQVELKLNSSL